MIVESTTTAPHTAATISAIAATVSVGSWLTDHAVFFTIGAAIAAVLSGGAACLFYTVSIYYKIKYERGVSDGARGPQGVQGIQGIPGKSGSGEILHTPITVTAVVTEVSK